MFQMCFLMLIGWLGFSGLLAGDFSDLEKTFQSQGLLNVQMLNPKIKVSLAYATTQNFLKQNVYGPIGKAYLQKEAAQKLAKAQKILEEDHPGFCLKVWDAARPRAVQYRMWDLVKNTSMQAYVANPQNGSIHNFGAAVDLTVVNQKGMELDMGTAFDYFGDLAQPRYEQKFLKEGKLSQKQFQNRKILRDAMLKAGFEMIGVEWWHFEAFSKKEVMKRYRMIE